MSGERNANAVVLLVAMLSTVLFAPFSVHARRFTLGPRIGMIVANITETPPEWDDDKEYRVGLSAGAFFDWSITETVSIQPEILYTRKGVLSNLYDGLVAVDLDAYFDYVELPIVLKYAFRPGERLRPCLYAGPIFAYCLSVEAQISAWILSTTVDFSSFAHTTDFGALVGAGLSYPLGPGAVTLDARFQRMFTNAILSGDFEIDGSEQTISEDDFKHYGFVFMAGYAF
ncbi:MAG: porin family protein [Candidatus Krumholzibacteria bacterium]|nr:porin family protein [Candidatus Krumholzibacteria bacterium]